MSSSSCCASQEEILVIQCCNGLLRETGAIGQAPIEALGTSSVGEVRQQTCARAVHCFRCLALQVRPSVVPQYRIGVLSPCFDRMCKSKAWHVIHGSVMTGGMSVVQPRSVWVLSHTESTKCIPSIASCQNDSSFIMKADQLSASSSGGGNIFAIQCVFDRKNFRSFMMSLGHCKAGSPFLSLIDGSTLSGIQLEHRSLRR